MPHAYMYMHSCVLHAGSSLSSPHLATMLSSLTSALPGQVWDGKVWHNLCLLYHSMYLYVCVSLCVCVCVRACVQEAVLKALESVVVTCRSAVLNSVDTNQPSAEEVQYKIHDTFFLCLYSLPPLNASFVPSFPSSLPLLQTLPPSLTHSLPPSFSRRLLEVFSSSARRGATAATGRLPLELWGRSCKHWNWTCFQNSVPFYCR